MSRRLTNQVKHDKLRCSIGSFPLIQSVKSEVCCPFRPCLQILLIQFIVWNGSTESESSVVLLLNDEYFHPCPMPVPEDHMLTNPSVLCFDGVRSVFS
ncbi:hypothetical protein BDW66DRAFT_31486 [Aspergillus desertorum]